MSGALNTAKGLGSSIMSGIGDFAGGVGDFFGDMFSSGNQPMAGGSDAASMGLSQGVTDIADVSGGADAGTMSASAFAGPGGGDALSEMLKGAGSVASGEPDAGLLEAIRAGGVSPGEALDSGGGGFSLRNLMRPQNAIPAALLGYTIYRGNQTPPEVGAMNDLARDAQARSQALNAGAFEAQQGRLPGGAQASIDQALEAARARIRSNYASMGMTGSSPEAQDLAYAQIAATAQAFQIGQGMASQGFQAAAGADSLAANLYANILSAETARGTALGDALAEFAAGLVDPDVVLGGGGGG